MAKPVRVLAFHGIGAVDLKDPDWGRQWIGTIDAMLDEQELVRAPDSVFMNFDRLFKDRPLKVVDYVKALGRLLGSGIHHGLGFDGAKGFGEDLFLKPLEEFRFTAGMVAQWSVDETLRKATRAMVTAALAQGPFDLVLAHSLGSLLVYDTLSRGEASLGSAVLATFGAQVGSAFVRDVFGGKLVPLKAARWFHLFNDEDHAFTARLPDLQPELTRVDTPFDSEGVLNHDPTEYLRHPQTRSLPTSLWPTLRARADLGPKALAAPTGASALTAARLRARPARASVGTAVAGAADVARAPDHRALLVGIDDYPDSENDLEGCVNDTYLVSSVLQETGFRAEDIRLVVNGRATAKTVKDRLAWLLEDPRPGDIRFFFYSGHGAQVPGYGDEAVVDHEDEVLVTHDFDWSDPTNTGITDDSILDLYSQLPYDMTFVMMLDCCHSGGMSRSGGARVRGLTPPDDVRHRKLKWSEEFQSWVPREFDPLAGKGARRDVRFFGKDGATRRLGGASGLRRLSKAQADREREAMGHRGPYLPVILSACQEGELSYEYRHGAQSFGAFTYAAMRILRRDRQAGITFEQLQTRTRDELKILGYDQKPDLIARTALATAEIPWPQGAKPKGSDAKPVARSKGRRPR